MDKNNGSVYLIITFAVALLIGAILINIIATETADKTQTVTVNNEAIAVGTATLGENATNEAILFTVANPPTYDCPLTSVSLTNYSGTALTETTNWVMNYDTGKFYLKNSTAVWRGFTNVNTTKVTYTYCPSDYINTSWARTIMNMVPGFFALGILIGVAFVIFYVLRKEGVELF